MDQTPEIFLLQFCHLFGVSVSLNLSCFNYGWTWYMDWCYGGMELLQNVNTRMNVKARIVHHLELSLSQTRDLYSLITVHSNIVYVRTELKLAAFWLRSNWNYDAMIKFNYNLMSYFRNWGINYFGKKHPQTYTRVYCISMFLCKLIEEVFVQESNVSDVIPIIVKQLHFCVIRLYTRNFHFSHQTWINLNEILSLMDIIVIKKEIWS